MRSKAATRASATFDILFAAPRRLAASLLCALVLTGCGGGNDPGTSPDPNTPPGGSSSGGSGGTPPASPSPGNKVAWSVYMGGAGGGLDVSACGIPYNLGGVCGQGVNVDSSGAFHEVWTSGTPNLLTVDGTMTATTFSAALRCVGSGATGSMSATANGSEYTGTATLSGRTVSLRVTRQFGPC